MENIEHRGIEHDLNAFTDIKVTSNLIDSMVIQK